MAASSSSHTTRVRMPRFPSARTSARSAVRILARPGALYFARRARRCVTITLSSISNLLDLDDRRELPRDGFEALRARVQLVRPPVPVVGSGRERVPEVEVAHVREGGLAGETPEHVVQPVDELDADPAPLSHDAVALPAEARLEPRTGERPPAPE